VGRYLSHYSNGPSSLMIELPHHTDSELWNGLSRSSFVKQLFLPNIPIETVPMLTSALSFNTNIKELYFNNLKLKTDDSKILIEGILDENSVLTRLVFENSVIGSKEALIHFGKALCKNPPLKELYLNTCGLHAFGIEPLSKALTKNTNLKILHLQNNCIRDSGLKKLSYGISSNNYIVEINLAKNYFSWYGNVSFLKGLSENHRLRNLVLIPTIPMPFYAKDEVLKELGKNFSVTKCLFGNYRKEINIIMKRNKTGYDLVNSAIITFVLIWKKQRKEKRCSGIISKDVMKIITKKIWKSRGQKIWCKNVKTNLK
jgi:Ran GTPase-activating protein (RanGAP) involved in mRNA processing and transport